MTKTGSNAFHGTASFLGMNHAMESDNISGPLEAQLLAAVPAYALAANPNPVVSGGIVSLAIAAADSLAHALTYSWTSSCPDPRAGASRHPGSRPTTG